MNTFQLSCFLNVAETLNFARAAEELNITQPAVTHQIHTLENELNVKLFKRTTRTVEITPAGNVFLSDAKNILAISSRAKKRFENPPEQEIQLFSIGCHSFTHLFLLPDILKRLASSYPRLHPRLQAVPFQHLYRLLEEEDVDAIIGFREPDSRKIPGIYKELAKIPVVCLCSRTNPLAACKTVTASELEKEKLVLNDPLKSPATVSRLQGQLMGGRMSSDFYFCDSTEALMVLVKAGFGISVLPGFLLPPDDDLALIPVEGLEPISFGVYYKSLRGNEVLKRFLRVMEEYFNEGADDKLGFN